MPGSGGTGIAGDAVGAAGDLRVGDPVGEGERQPERHDAEVVRLHAQRGRPDQQADHRGGEHGEHRRHPEAEAAWVVRIAVA